MLKFFPVFCLLLISSVSGMKRPAAGSIEYKAAKRQRKVSVEAPVQPAAQIQGDDLFMDIWQSIFNQCDGMTIVPLTLVCKRFHQQVKEKNPELVAKFDSPEGLLERMVTSSKHIRLTHKPLIKTAIPSAFINGVDVKRVAKLLVRMKSTVMCNYVMAKVAAELTTINEEAAEYIEEQLVNQVLLEYASLNNHPAGSFPSDLADFEKYLTENEFDVWTDFPLSSLLMPLTYFSDSDILTEKILESVLLKIWKEIFGEGESLGHDAWKKIRLVFNNDSSLVSKFHTISPYLSETAVHKYTKKFTLIATTFHNCSNHHYHELFRLFLSKAFDRTHMVYDEHAKGNLDKDRRAVCEEAHNLKSLFRMAVEYGISLAPMVESVQRWLNLATCTQTLRRTVQSVLVFSDKVQTSDEFSWLPSEDINLAVELLNSLATGEKIADLIKSIWTVECPITRTVVLKLASKRTNETFFALHDFLIPLGWVFFEENIELKPLDGEPLGTLVGLMPSGLALKSLYEVFECIKMPKTALRAFALDVELIWLHRSDEAFDATKFHQLLSGLPPQILQKLARFLRLHWFLQPTLHLSGQLDEFYQLFPYLASNTNEGAVVTKATGHKLGLHRMKVSLRRFNLDQATFASNMADLVPTNI